MIMKRIMNMKTMRMRNTIYGDRPPVFVVKHGKARKGKRKMYLQTIISTSIASLAAGDVVKTDHGAVVVDRVYALWAKGVWSLNNNGASDGPVMVGLVHGDYTAAEIEEALEAAGSWDRSDKIAVEQARRKVRRSGTFAGLDTAEKLANGVEIYQKLGCIIEDGETLSMWARNTDPATRAASGSVNFNGIICVVPT